MVPCGTLKDIGEAHCRTLTESLSRYKYNYTGSITTAYFSPAVNLEGASYTSTVHNIISKNFKKDEFVC